MAPQEPTNSARLPSDAVSIEVANEPPLRLTGLALRDLRLALDPDAAANGIREQAELIASLQGYPGARFVLQYLALPTDLDPGSRFRIDILPVAPEDQIATLMDDLCDLLEGHDRWYRFEPVTDTDELNSVVFPFRASAVREVIRREEPIGTALLRRGVGFGADLDDASAQQLSAFSSFQSTTDARRSLIELLLAQDTATVLRVTLAPTTITGDELRGLGSLEQLWPLDSSGPAEEAAHAALRSMSFTDPNFEVQILVATEARMSVALVESVGVTISPPQSQWSGEVALGGGCAVLDVADTSAFDRSLIETVTEHEPSGVSPPAIRRLRRVMGPWEAGAAFRLPVAEEPDFPGLPVLRTPSLRAGWTRLPANGSLIGEVRSAGGTTEIRLGEVDRFRHTYVLGQTGTGKSTLLENLIAQDIEAGRGVAVIDPHGDLVEAVLRRVPRERVDDVVLLDPSDPEAVIGINLLEAETAVQADYLISDLCAFFQQLFDPHSQGIVGPRFQSWLRRACATLLPVPGQGTICDVPRLFMDDDYLKFCFRYVTDPVVQDFWVNEMGKTSDYHRSEMLGWFSSKFEPFRSNRMVRNVLGQPRSTVAMTEIMDGSRILLVKLSKGLMGEYNAALMGYVVLAKLWAATLGRAAVEPEQRVPFHVYADEFQSMTSPALPSILSEARKFGVSLTMANQFFSQIRPELRESIMGNVGSKLVFRLGATDAREYAAVQGGSVTESNLLRLPNHVLVANLLVGGEPTEPILAATLPPGPGDPAQAEAARLASRARNARPVDEVDRVIDDLYRNYRERAASGLSASL